MKKKLTYVLILSLTVLTAVGIVLGVQIQNNHNEFEKSITLTESGETKETLEINISGLYPGKRAEYTIRLGGNGSFAVSLKFNSGNDVALAQYLNMEIELDGKLLDDGTLSEFLDGEALVFDCETNSKNPAKLVIRYTMPLDVGNEAQKTVADFKIDLTAKIDKRVA